MKKSILATLLTVSAVLGLSGCQNVLPTTSTKYPILESKSIKTETVAYQLIQGEKRQTQNQVSMTLEPVSIEDADIYHRISVKPLFTLISTNGQKDYELTYNPVISQDERLKFTLKVSNSSSRVLRPSGAVLTFRVDGSSTSVKSDNYQELLNMMIVPNSNSEITVAGPKLSELKKSKGVMAIDLYEVKVGDNLSNYSWILEYEKKEGVINTTVKAEKVSMTPYDAQNINGKTVKIDN